MHLATLTPSPETARLMARVERSHAEFVGGTAPDVQAMLRNAIEACVRLARGADNNRPAAVILAAGARVE